MPTPPLPYPAPAPIPGHAAGPPPPLLLLDAADHQGGGARDGGGRGGLVVLPLAQRARCADEARAQASAHDVLRLALLRCARRVLAPGAMRRESMHRTWHARTRPMQGRHARARTRTQRALHSAWASFRLGGKVGLGHALTSPLPATPLLFGRAPSPRRRVLSRSPSRVGCPCRAPCAPHPSACWDSWTSYFASATSTPTRR